MADGDRLPDERVVMRRFDPTFDGHWSVDEATGESRLRSGAFIFDDEPEYGGKGCSVFQEAVLASRGHSQWAVIEVERAHWTVAKSRSGVVRAVTRAGMTPSITPFDVVEAPDDDDVPGVAHALVTHAANLTGASRWYRELAKAFNAELRATA